MDTYKLAYAMFSDPTLGQVTGGVCAADHLPGTIIKRPSFFIVNTGDHRSKGLHWTAFYFPGGVNTTVKFFDSLGHPPGFYHKWFENTCISNGPTYMYNNTQLQSNRSVVCGQYALTYCYFRARGVSMAGVVRKYGDNKQLNDSEVNDFVNRTFHLRTKVYGGGLKQVSLPVD
jgi:hypothetical protein